MANRKTGLDVSVFNTMGGVYLGDLENVRVDVNNKTAEGKGIADVDDWPVLVGRGTKIQATLLVASGGTALLAGTATSSNPAGTVLLTTGAGGGWSGTAVITGLGHVANREDVQKLDIELTARGPFPFA